MYFKARHTFTLSEVSHNLEKDNNRSFLTYRGERSASIMRTWPVGMLRSLGAEWPPEFCNGRFSAAPCTPRYKSGKASRGESGAGAWKTPLDLPSFRGGVTLLSRMTRPYGIFHRGRHLLPARRSFVRDAEAAAAYLAPANFLLPHCRFSRQPRTLDVCLLLDG